MASPLPHRALLLIAGVLLPGLTCGAPTNVWTGPVGGSWDDAASWSLGAPPTSGQVARMFLPDGVPTVTGPAAATTVRRLELEGVGTFSDLRLQGGDLTVTGNTVITDLAEISVGTGVALDSWFIDVGGRLRLTGGTVVAALVSVSGTLLGQGDVDAEVVNAGVVTAETGPFRFEQDFTNGPTGTLDALIGWFVFDQDFTNQGVFAPTPTPALTVGGLLTNEGSFMFPGGMSHVTAISLMNTGSFELQGRITGPIQNDGTLTARGSNGLVLDDDVQNDGLLRILAFSRLDASSDIHVGPNGSLEGNGATLRLWGDLRSTSQMNLAWSTETSTLEFVDAVSHTLRTTAADLGAFAAGYVDNYAWDTLHLPSGASLTLEDGDAVPGGAVYLGAFELADGISQIASITGNGLNVYYDPARPENAYLANQTHPLAGGGAIVPVP